MSIDKSKALFSRNILVGDRALFCDAMNIQEENDINPYLRFPLSGTRPAKACVKFLMNKINGKLGS